MKNMDLLALGFKGSAQHILSVARAPKMRLAPQGQADSRHVRRIRLGSDLVRQDKVGALDYRRRPLVPKLRVSAATSQRR